MSYKHFCCYKFIGISLVLMFNRPNLHTKITIQILVAIYKLKTRMYGAKDESSWGSRISHPLLKIQYLMP
jgi:hypothetical protein